MPWRITSEPTKKERIIGALCYLTFGIAGLLYILLSKGAPEQSPQFRFHFMQSIFLWILGTLVAYATSPLMGIFFGVLSAVAHSAVPAVLQVVGVVSWLLIGAYNLVLLYGAIMAFLGKFAEIPFISSIVYHNMR